jgi:hypothetical protein
MKLSPLHFPLALSFLGTLTLHADLSLLNGTMDGGDGLGGAVPHWTHFESKKPEGQNYVGGVVTQKKSCVSDSAGKIVSADVGKWIHLSFDVIKTHDTGITGVVASLCLDNESVSEVTVSKEVLTNSLQTYRMASYKVRPGDVGKEVTVQFDSDNTGEEDWNQVGVDNVKLGIFDDSLVASFPASGQPSQDLTVASHQKEKSSSRKGNKNAHPSSGRISSDTSEPSAQPEVLLGIGGIRLVLKP